MMNREFFSVFTRMQDISSDIEYLAAVVETLPDATQYEDGMQLLSEWAIDADRIWRSLYSELIEKGYVSIAYFFTLAVNNQLEAVPVDSTLSPVIVPEGEASEVVLQRKYPFCIWYPLP